MKQFFLLALLFVVPLLLQISSADTDRESIGPSSLEFEIATEQTSYHYSFEDGHEKIRIFAKISQIIPNEKIKIKSVYSMRPHSFTDVYSICSDTTSTNCFARLDEGRYFVESKRQYGNLFGKWALDATYAGKKSTDVFEITTLKRFELDTTKQKYTINDLKTVGLELVFLGSEISNQTTVMIEVFKINENGQDIILKQEVPVEIIAQPPYFNKLPVTFPNKVPFDVGKYNITATWGELFDAETFQVVESALPDKPKGNNGGCLIATAAFGTDLAPQVQLLREFRDGEILATKSGAGFMQAFNSFYYSFSPPIADMERQSLPLREIIQGVLYPLVGILTISQATTVFGGEYDTLMSGFIASTLIGIVYLWPVSLRFDFTRIYNKIILSIITSLGMVVIGIVFSDTVILMISTVAFVIASLAFGIVLTRKTINLVKSKNKKRF